MSFHDGIAPVQSENIAFFINTKNIHQFNRDFEKAYGFYNDISTVKDKNGWFHINKTGQDIHNDRYSWSGNYNENKCIVKDFNDNYFHINPYGERVYSQNYVYAGDFKYNIAVVVDYDGKHTHIKDDGDLLHGKLFNELDIFHKGYAVAKDDKGYFHIDKKGNELYCQRYQKLEDFYNGFSYATSFDNTKVLLDKSEYKEIKITVAPIDKEKILNESFMYFKYQVLFAILKLDVLKNIQLNKTIHLPEVSLKLIFRWLYSEKIINEKKQLTHLGEVLENELKTIILYWQDLPFKTSSYMLESIQSGNEYFSKIFNKRYFDFLENDTYYLNLTQNINDYYQVDYSHLINFFNLKNEIVCDIGGGNGMLLNALQKKYIDIQPIIADKFINNKKKNNVKIDFFEPFIIKSDIFLMSRILHDWDDNKAIQILQNIANNMSDTSILYILETIAQEYPKIDRGETLSFHLLNFIGGHERSLDDFKFLLKKSKLKIIKIYSENSLISLMKVKKI